MSNKKQFKFSIRKLRFIKFNNTTNEKKFKIRSIIHFGQ